MAWGGARPGSGRKPTARKKANPNAVVRRVAEPIVRPAEKKVPAEPKPDAAVERAWAALLPQIAELTERYALHKARASAPELNPYKLPTFPKSSLPPEPHRMAMDGALSTNLGFGSDAWLSGDPINGAAAQGLLFPGFAILSELAVQPEYRIMTETIADDATRKWIDFDVVGDEAEQREDRAKDPDGYDERMADPDERRKRVKAAGKTDRVKELKDDQLRLEVQARYYEQARNGGFFGRSHLFHDIRTVDTDEIDTEELKQPIGDSRSEMSRSKVPVGSFKALRTIEPAWAYPLAYNAINPLRGDWYCPQVWYVQGQEIHGTRIPTFIPHPVPDMLKPAYAFGGLSLTQMAKPYVDRWLTTVTSVSQLVHSFSVMALGTDLSTLVQPNNASSVLARVAMFNMLRDNMGTFVYNKATEEFKNVSAQLGGLHELQAQSQEHIASINRIPLVKFTGIQPMGLNASSEGEIEVYDDTIGAYQMRVMDPNLRRTINFEMLSLWGEVDPEITHRWNVLRPMTQAEKGQKEKDDADRDQKYVDMGAIAPGEVRKRIIDDEDLPYTGLDPDEMPEPPADEGLLGPGAGGAASEHERLDAGGGAEQRAGAPPKRGVGTKGGAASDAMLPFARDAAGWNEGDHPRGQPGNAGQFGSGGGGGGPKTPQKGAGPGQKKRLYGGLYRQTGRGPEADHRATVEYALGGPPRAGKSYRELLARLVKDAPKMGGDVERLKAQLAGSMMLARDQLLTKAMGAATEAERAHAERQAGIALEKAKALGWGTQGATPAPPKAAQTRTSYANVVAGDWAGAGSPTPKQAEWRAEEQERLLRHGMERNTEDVGIWDAARDGPIALDGLVASRGARNVMFTERLVEMLADPSRRLEMHHNHPGDTSFSLQDLDVLAASPGMSRLYAHGHGGSTFVVDAAHGSVGSIYTYAMEKARDAATATLARHGTSRADANYLFAHAIMVGLDRAGAISGYAATPGAAMLKTLKENHGFVRDVSNTIAEGAAAFMANLGPKR